MYLEIANDLFDSIADGMFRGCIIGGIVGAIVGIIVYLSKKQNYDDEKIAENKVKLMNKINFDCLMEQISEKKRSKSKRNIMTNTEFEMNRDLIEKAREDEKNSLQMPQV